MTLPPLRWATVVAGAGLVTVWIACGGFASARIELDAGPARCRSSGDDLGPAAARRGADRTRPPASRRGAKATKPQRNAIEVQDAAPLPPPTFTRDVAPIVYAKCAPCHRPGGSGPFSLLDYTEARKHARQIERVTASRYMPPWLPEAGYGRFAGERRLADFDIDTLRRWVEGGSVEGDPAELPPRPVWPAGWQLGEPDLVVRLPRPYTLRAAGPDDFRNLVIPVPLERPRWVRAFEFHPGNPRAVHHAVIHFDRTHSSRRLDAEDPEPGFAGMPGSGVRSFEGHFVGWTPGNLPEPFREGVALRLDPASDLVLHLHMLPTGREEALQPEVGLYFTDEPPRHEPYLLRLGSKTIDIPPGESAYEIRDRYRLPVDVEVLAVYPHAHYIGRTMEGWATLPDGSRTWLLKIDDWDFDWQDDYNYVEPVSLPAGSVVEMRYTYDNTATNPRNPSTPPQRVVFGPGSANEMGDLWLQVTARDARDLARLRESFDRREALAQIAGLEQMLQSFPDHADYRNALALLYLKVGEIEPARSHLEGVLARDPGQAEAHRNLALLLAATGRASEAIAHLGQAVALAPGDVEAHNNLGVLLRSAGRLDEAIAQYRETLRLAPDHAGAHQNLGVALRAHGDLADAIDELRRAVALEPDSPRARFNLADALAARGDVAEAEIQYGEALRLEPGFVAARVRLGDLRLGAGRLPEAIATYREALQSAPDHPGAREGLERALDLEHHAAPRD